MLGRLNTDFVWLLGGVYNLALNQVFAFLPRPARLVLIPILNCGIRDEITQAAANVTAVLNGFSQLGYDS